MTANNSDNSLLDQQLLDQQLLEQRLITALTSQQQPPEAWELLGLSAERYQRIAELADQRPQLPGALTALGLDCCYQQQEGSRELAIARPPTIAAPRAVITRRVAEILWPLIPEQRRLLVIFSQVPESAIFNLLPDDRQLTLFLDPRGQQRPESPGPGWEEVPGGWRRRNFLAPRCGYFINAERGGEYRLSAANRQQVSAELQELLAVDAWPPGPERQEQLSAQGVWRKINAIAELMADYQDYRQQRHWQQEERDEELLDLDQRVSAQQQELQELRQELAEAEELLAASQRQQQEARQRQQDFIANQDLDKRQAIASSWRLLAAVEQINLLPEVERAEVYDPFACSLDGPELYVQLRATENQPAVSFHIRQGAVFFAGQERPDLQSRELAWAEKFATGQWLQLVKMIIKALDK